MPQPEPTFDPLRPGEKAIEGLAATDACLTFIGHIETPWATRADCPRQGDSVEGPVCHVRVDPTWAEALDGIDRHAMLQILYWMHLARRDLVRLAPSGRALQGPFALRAPTRPNPIASAIVTVVERHGSVLHVRGLDCCSGTPLLDIKPFDIQTFNIQTFNIQTWRGA